MSGDEASIAAAAERLKGEPIGTLINNAGIMGTRRTGLQLEAAEFMDIMRVNVLGPVLVTRAFLPNLRAAKGAKVAVISSLMGSFSYETTSYIAYSTSKTAVNRMFNSLARELAGDGIHVAILSPGWVRTDMGGPNATLSVGGQRARTAARNRAHGRVAVGQVPRLCRRQDHVVRGPWAAVMAGLRRP